MELGRGDVERLCTARPGVCFHPKGRKGDRRILRSEVAS